MAIILLRGNVFTRVCDSVHRGEGGLCQGDTLSRDRDPPQTETLRPPRTETP